MSRAHAYQDIRSRSLELVDEHRLDAMTDVEDMRAVVLQAVEEYQRRASLGDGRTLGDPVVMVDRVMSSLAEFGPLTSLLSRSDVEEIFIEGTRVRFIDGSGRLKSLDQPTTSDENEQVVERLLAESDRRLDTSSPIVQARVLDNTARLTAVIPPISDQMSVTIRRYALRRETLGSMVELGSVSPAAASFLQLVMQTPSSVLISGQPGAGKTSLLSALINAAPPSHCIRCCEEVRELQVPLVHGSFYEARPPGLDGTGAITLRDLVKAILAMRPDRIVVGEVRGAEAFELTRAVNAGTGFACTVHANSAGDALMALVNAALMAGENVPETVVRNVFAASIDLIVHLDREMQGESEGPIRRQVMEILSVAGPRHDGFSVEPLFIRDRLGAGLRWTGALPSEVLAGRLEHLLPNGVALTDIMSGEVSY